MSDQMRVTEKALLDSRNAMLDAYRLLQNAPAGQRDVSRAKGLLRRQLQEAGLVNSRGDIKFG